MMTGRHRFHLAVPDVTTMSGRHRVTFVGVTFYSRRIMIEYNVDPPVGRGAHPLGPRLVGLVVTDTTSPDPYPTSWEDFDWSVREPGRLTTCLDRRPPPEATSLDVSVRCLQRDNRYPTSDRLVASDAELVAFAVALPADHAADRRTRRSTSRADDLR